MQHLAAANIPAEVDAPAHIVTVPARCGPICLRRDERLPFVHIVSTL